MRKLLVALVGSLVLLAGPTRAQESSTPAPEPVVVSSGSAHAGTFHAGTLGLAFAWPGGTGTTAGAIYFLGSAMAPFVEVGVNWDKKSDDDRDASQTDSAFVLTGGMRLYTARSARLHTYLAPSAFLSRTSHSEASGDVEVSTTTTKFGLAGDLGVEYLFNEAFSLGGSVGADLAFAGADKHGETIFSTHRSAILATFYW